MEKNILKWTIKTSVSHWTNSGSPSPFTVLCFFSLFVLCPSEHLGDVIIQVFDVCFSPQVILVQVNPGEAFTIRREDGQFQCITGKTLQIVVLLLVLSYRWVKGQ